MSKLFIFSGLAVSAATLVAFGIKKYNQLQGLRRLRLTLGNPPITFTTVSDKLINGSINLLIDNPTEYDYHIKNFEGFIKSGNKQVLLGALLLADAKIYSTTKNNYAIATTIQLNQLVDLVKDIFFNSEATIFLTGTVTYVANSVEVPYPFAFSVDLKDQLNQFISLKNLPINL